MVQVHSEGVISKTLEGLVVVAIHVAHQEVQDNQINDVKQPESIPRSKNSTGSF